MTRRTGKRRTLRLNARRAAVTRAGRLLDDGQTAQARTLLEEVLPPQPPVGAAPDRCVIDAAVLWVNATRDDPATYPARLEWARYACDASRALPSGSPDLGRRQDSTDAYASALDRLGRHEEAFAACREGIEIAYARGDIEDALDRRVLLATKEHDRDCGTASSDALAVLAEAHERHPDTSSTSLVQTLPVLFALETCHRHDHADRVAARIRVTDLTDPDGSDGLGVILDSIGTNTGTGVQHTARVHPDAVCARADCPVSDPSGATPPEVRQRAMNARLFGCLLAGYDPGSAAPHPALINVANRFAAVADPTLAGNTPSPLAWARYAHTATLQTAGLDWLAAVTATREAADTFHRLGRPHDADQAWQRLAAFTEHLDADDAVTCRMAIAERRYREGRCDEALTMARDAVTAWWAQQTETTPSGMVAVLRADLLFDGCHRHDELPDDQRIDLTAFSNGDNATVFTLYMYGLTVMAEHARTYHPDHPCTEPKCREHFALAWDVPHQRLIRTVEPRYQEGHFDEVAATIGDHLSSLDPATSPATKGLVGLAMLYCDAAAFAATSSDNPATATAAARPSILAWTEYARRAAIGEDPTRAQWVTVSRTVARAVSLSGAHTEAIQLARDVLDHQLAARDTAGAITARLDLANALQAAGRCDEAGTEADTAWSDAQRHYDPADPEQRSAALLAGTDAGFMHGDCHRHEQAGVTVDTVMRLYSGTPGTNQTDQNDQAAQDRERRWQNANAAFYARRERHDAAYHPAGSCEQHEAKVNAMVHRWLGNRLTGATP